MRVSSHSTSISAILKRLQIVKAFCKRLSNKPTVLMSVTTQPGFLVYFALSHIQCKQLAND